MLTEKQANVWAGMFRQVAQTAATSEPRAVGGWVVLVGDQEGYLTQFCDSQESCRQLFDAVTVGGDWTYAEFNAYQGGDEVLEGEVIDDER